MLAVIVVNYGSHILVEGALRDLDWQRSDARAIVVDSFFSEAERVKMAALADGYGWDFLALDTNAGFGAGFNAGCARARELDCEVVIALNPDAQITVEVLDELHRQAKREPLALVSPRVVTPTGAVEFDGAYVDLVDGTMHGNHGELVARRSGELLLDDIEGTRDWRGWLTGACVAAHRELLERVGGFDESLFLYWEDVDLSYRVRAAGGSLIVRMDLDVIHDEGGTQHRADRQTGSRAKSSNYYYYNCRNRLAFASRHLKTRQVLRWVAATPRASWAILLRGGRRQLLRSRAPLRSAVRGSGAGLALAGRRLAGDVVGVAHRRRRG